MADFDAATEHRGCDVGIMAEHGECLGDAAAIEAAVAITEREWESTQCTGD